MPVEVYLREDIDRVIAGLTALAVESCRAKGRGDEYAHGMLTMARSVALSFGCNWDLILSRLSRTGDGWVLSEASHDLLTE